MEKKLEKLGIYIHIPFCVRKCIYCDFYSICDLSQTDIYVKALIEQIKSYHSERKPYLVETIYLGGGTPSLLSGKQVYDIIYAVRKTFRVADDAEITMEANPGTLDTEKLNGYHKAGITRLSIGLQSANNDELAMIGRIHTRQDFESSYNLARLEGFDNINIDLMFALPGQTLQTVLNTIDYVISLEPEHISFYNLILGEETPLAQNPELVEKIPDEDLQTEIYMSCAERLEQHGFLQYEISNFAKPGFECHHNLDFWLGHEYLGFGPAANSIFKGKSHEIPWHFECPKEFLRFLENPTERFDSEQVDEKDVEKSWTPEFREFLYIDNHFRTVQGINIENYKKIFKKDFNEVYLERMKPYMDRNEPEDNQPYILKTPDGYRFSRYGLWKSQKLVPEIFIL